MNEQINDTICAKHLVQAPGFTYNAYDPDIIIPIEDESRINLLSEYNQEKDCIKKEAIRQLSKEALQVLMIIFNTPSEIVKIPKYELRRFFKKQFKWKHKQIDKAFDELTQLANNL